MRTRSLLRAATLVLLWPASASAGNDDELFVGNSAALMGGAVSATVEDASAAWYNPAGLGGIERNQIDVSGTVYTLRFYSVPKFLSATSGASKDASVTEFLSVPTQIAYARALAPGVALGLGYFVPWGTSLVLRERLAVDDAAGHSQWQLGLALSRIQHNAVSALGVSVARGLRLGLSVVGSYEAETESSVLFGAVGTPPEALALTQFTALGTGHRIALELGLGAQVDLGPRVALGIAGRTPRLQVARSHDYVLTQGEGITLPTGETVLTAGVAEGETPADVVEWVRAGRLGVSLAYRYAGRSRVCAEVDVQPGIEDRAGEVRRRAVVNARLGVYQTLTTGLTLGAGLFTDRSADILDGSPVNGTSHLYGASLGLELSNEHRLARDEPAESLQFDTVFALRYAFGDGVFDGLSVDPEDPHVEAFGARRTRLVSHELGLYVGSGLEF